MTVVAFLPLIVVAVVVRADLRLACVTGFSEQVGAARQSRHRGPSPGAAASNPLRGDA